MAVKKANVSPEESAKLIEEAQKDKDYKICGFIFYDKNNNVSVCTKPAGWGTSHPGEGKCRLHGGVGRPCITGKRSIFKSSNIKTLYERIQEYKDILVKDHQESLKLVHALLNILDEVIKTSHLDVTTIEAIRRVLETKVKIEELELKRQEKSHVTEEEILMLVSSILDVIDECVSNIEEKKKIFSRIKNLSFFRRNNIDEKE